MANGAPVDSAMDSPEEGGKKNDIGTQMWWWWWWWGVRSCGLHELSSRVEQKKSALLQFKDVVEKKNGIAPVGGVQFQEEKKKKNVNNRYIKRDPCSWVLMSCVSLQLSPSFHALFIHGCR